MGTSIKHSKAKVMALELGLAEAAIIMAVVLEALEALEAGLVTASTSEAAEASSVLVGEDLVGVVALTIEDMGGGWLLELC